MMAPAGWSNPMSNTADGDDWNGTISYSYGYDPNGNLTGIETGVPSAKAQGAMIEPKFGTRLAGEAFPLEILKAAAAEGTSTSFSRSGADQLTSAKLASGSDVTLSYDSSNLYGDVGQMQLRQPRLRPGAHPRCAYTAGDSPDDQQ